MKEQWDIVELKAVAQAFEEFERRCNEIAEAIGEKRYLPAHDLAHVQALYRALKTELKEATKYSTLSGRRQPQTRIESAFYDPAVRKAHISLRPATNSNPIQSRWLDALWEAQSEFSYYRHQIESVLAK